MAKMDELSDDPKEFLSAALKSPEAYGFLVKHASVDTEKLYESMLPGIASALPPSGTFFGSWVATPRAEK